MLESEVPSTSESSCSVDLLTSESDNGGAFKKFDETHDKYSYLNNSKSTEKMNSRSNRLEEVRFSSDKMSKLQQGKNVPFLTHIKSLCTLYSKNIKSKLHREAFCETCSSDPNDSMYRLFDETCVVKFPDDNTSCSVLFYKTTKENKLDTLIKEEVELDLSQSMNCIETSFLKCNATYKSGNKNVDSCEEVSAEINQNSVTENDSSFGIDLSQSILDVSSNFDFTRHLSSEDSISKSSSLTSIEEEDSSDKKIENPSNKLSLNQLCYLSDDEFSSSDTSSSTESIPPDQLKIQGIQSAKLSKTMESNNTI